MEYYRPLIGICSEPDETLHRVGTWRSYPQCIFDAGGIPVMLPFGDMAAEVAEDIAQRIDGLLLTGGGDLAPYSFGGHAYQNDTTSPIDWVSPLRDVFEEAICKAAWEAELPVLGICRGMQVMNVVHGGSLVRDVKEIERENPIKHPNFIDPDTTIHEVRLTEGSHVAEILGTTQLEVNSRHHQAVTCIAGDARVVGLAPDGIVEALEWPDRPFFLGVQWHPETIDTTRELFDALVAAARNYADTRL